MTEGLHATGIIVNDKPYAFWGTGLKEQNRSHVFSIDPDLWKNLFNNAIKPFAEESNDSQLLIASATAARIQLGLALETLFALLFAAIQAPHYVVGWLQHYRNRDIDSLINKVNSGSRVSLGVKLNPVSWPAISDLIHCEFALSDKKIEKETKARLAEVIETFAQEYIDEGMKQEFNSLKHSMRVRAGGFGMSCSFTTRNGESSGDIHLGQGDYGSTYYRSLPIPNMGRNQRILERVSYNWNLARIKESMELIRILIHNVRTFILGHNGFLDGEHAVYLYPLDLERLGKSERSVNCPISLSFKEELDFANVKDISDEQIHLIYRQFED